MKNLIRNFVHKIALASAMLFAGTVILTGALVMMFIVLSVFRPDDIEFFKSLF